MLGGSIAPTSLLAGAPVAIATGLLVGLSVLLLGRVLTTAVRLLDPLEAVRRLLAVARGDEWPRFAVGARAMTGLTDDDRAAAAQGLDLDFDDNDAGRVTTWAHSGRSSRCGV